MSSGYFDIILAKPLAETWLRGLLFTAFFLHFIFVLFTIGTAVIGFTYYVRSRIGNDTSVVGWDKSFLGSFFAHKSLAIVLGVGPILLMQVNNSIPFITASTLLAPLWIGLIFSLIIALVLLEVLRERHAPGKWGYFTVGVLGVASILAVPATFTAVLATTERPTAWQFIFSQSRLPRLLSIHWLLRLLHVFGAAVVFTAAFHWIRGAREVRGLRDRAPEKQAALARWIMGGIAVQIPLGVALLISTPRSLESVGAIVLIIGITAAAAVLWLVYRANSSHSSMGAHKLVFGLLTLLAAMLLARQILQDKLLIPFDRLLKQNAQAHSKTISENEAVAIENYRTVSEIPYDNPLTIYAKSCHFCHGAVGNGQGHEAINLVVPPQDLTGVRAGDDEIRRILHQGIVGTAMPEFNFYTSKRINELIHFLRTSMALKERPEPLNIAPKESARKEARQLFENTCATCHGKDGRGTALSSAFRPPPPDFTAYSLSPKSGQEVLSLGYPGTLMPSFAMYSEEIRWGLVEIVHSFYRVP